MKKRFCFTIDDNIRFLRELTESNAQSIFSHPYAGMLKDLHERYGVKVQLNLFYKENGFTLAQMTERFFSEWQENADWLKLSFHSLEETVEPYKNADYQTVYDDCLAVQKEIKRFAGERVLAKTTTVHYCTTTRAGVRALKDNGVQGLLGLYGTQENPRVSYGCSKKDGEILRNGEIARYDGVSFMAIHTVLNCFSVSEILSRLQEVKMRDKISVMIHEQYFYPDYHLYQENFKEKLEKTFAFLNESGFQSVFFEEMI